MNRAQTQAMALAMTIRAEAGWTAWTTRLPGGEWRVGTVTPAGDQRFFHSEADWRCFRRGAGTHVATADPPRRRRSHQSAGQLPLFGEPG